jgi:hypothetical protein
MKAAIVPQAVTTPAYGNFKEPAPVTGENRIAVHRCRPQSRGEGPSLGNSLQFETYGFGFHSLASFCASVICAGLIRAAKRSLHSAAPFVP